METEITFAVNMNLTDSLVLESLKNNIQEFKGYWNLLEDINKSLECFDNCQTFKDTNEESIGYSYSSEHVEEVTITETDVCITTNSSCCKKHTKKVEYLFTDKVSECFVTLDSSKKNELKHERKRLRRMLLWCGLKIGFCASYEIILLYWRFHGNFG